MPFKYRLVFALLGVLLLCSGLLGLYVSPRLAGWPQLRGVLGGLIAAGLGARVTWYAYDNRLPEWLTAVLGDPEGRE
ncbi:MAG: hypothetical protein WD934_01395 [Gemmatimonadales bacterium]